MDRFDKFTQQARKVFQLAEEEALRLNHNYIGTEHLLLGLLREGNGVAAAVLASLGIKTDRVRKAVEFIVGRGKPGTTGNIGLSPPARKVIELSVEEARRLMHGHIGTEHLLLGLVREGEGIAAGVLESFGASLDRVRARTISALSRTAPEADPAPPISAKEAVDAFIEAWNETDDDARRRLLARAWADDGVYVSPPPRIEVRGHDALGAYIAGFQRRVPGSRMVLASPIDQHGQELRYTWRLLGPDDAVVCVGSDVAEQWLDGRLVQVTTWDESPPREQR